MRHFFLKGTRKNTETRKTIADKQKTKHKELISSDNCMSTLCTINFVFYLYVPFEDCQDYKSMSCSKYIGLQIFYQFHPTRGKGRIIHSGRGNAEGCCMFCLSLCMALYCSCGIVHSIT